MLRETFLFLFCQLSHKRCALRWGYYNDYKVFTIFEDNNVDNKNVDMKVSFAIDYTKGGRCN